MRQMEFKMERPGLVEPGQIVDVTEGVVELRIFIIRLSRLWQ